MTGRTGNKNVDIFAYYDGTQIVTEQIEWASDVARGLSLARQDGVLVRAVFPEKRYLGTVRTYAAGLTCDTKISRFVFNAENRVPRLLERRPAVQSWSCGSTLWRSANAEDAYVEMVVGDADNLLELVLVSGGRVQATRFLFQGIGESTSAPMADDCLGETLGGTDVSGFIYLTGNCQVRTCPSLGFHRYHWIEKETGGAILVYGTGDTSMSDRGLMGSFKG